MDRPPLSPHRKQVHQDVEEAFHSNDNGEFVPNLDQLELIQLGVLLDTAFEVQEDNRLVIEHDDKAAESATSDLESERRRNRIMASEFRRRQGTRLLNWFSAGMEKTDELDRRFALTLNGFTLECPVGLWVDFKLSELWRNDTPLRECEQCGTIFAPTTKRAKYCRRGGGRDKKYRRKSVRGPLSLGQCGCESRRL